MVVEVEDDEGGGEDEEEERVDFSIDGALEEGVGIGKGLGVVVAATVGDVGQTVAMCLPLCFEDGEEQLAVSRHGFTLCAPGSGTKCEAPCLRRGVNEYVVRREERRKAIVAPGGEPHELFEQGLLELL